MAIRPNSEDRSFGADRERQREVSNESGRTARASSSDNAARGDQSADSGQARSRSNRGFASMDREKQREIASKGGRAAHQKGTAHEFDSSEARAAGRKGGVTVSRNREHMAAIGRRGGEARGANRAARMQGDNGLSAPTAGSQGNAQSSNATSGNNSARFQGDREVGLRSSSSVANGGAASANRSSGNSLGGERTSSANAESNVERP
ncbi:MAG TPA: KGG domain-containing protein [Gemmatimonadaceae bacterium]|nr:KGG domain-containing protein [Gemmatimonadaceae bacterium]